MISAQKTVLLAVLAALTLGASAGAMAREAGFDKTHPRRAEVNHRLNNQNHRINNEVKRGEMTHRQANKLRGEDRTIRKEERHMAARDAGHITARNQVILNNQENRVSNQINKQ